MPAPAGSGAPAAAAVEGGAAAPATLPGAAKYFVDDKGIAPALRMDPASEIKARSFQGVKRDGFRESSTNVFFGKESRSCLIRNRLGM